MIFLYNVSECVIRNQLPQRVIIQRVQEIHDIIALLELHDAADFFSCGAHLPSLAGSMDVLLSDRSRDNNVPHVIVHGGKEVIIVEAVDTEDEEIMLVLVSSQSLDRRRAAVHVLLPRSARNCW